MFYLDKKNNHPNSGNGGINGSGPGSLIPIPHAVRLRWKYDTEYPRSLVGFKIYRKSPVNYNTDAVVTSPEFILLKTITKDRAQKNSQFFNLDGFTWFDRTVVPMKAGKYEYKIIAEHSDGGYSNWSEVLEIIYR